MFTFRVILILLLACTAVSAQSVSTAQINGAVRDQSGAALPGVTVTVTQTEIFNVLNRVHVNNPVSALNNPNFGQITSAGDPRIVQLALKYTF